MLNNERVVVSMTSYPARICNVGKAIYFLLSSQTVKPDEIHLWLAEQEFPNREKDLPPDLNKIWEVCNEQVFIHWLPKNTFCHKRHEIFKYTKDTDCVFIFDDDVKYNDQLIETVMNDHQKYPNAVINYNYYALHEYNGRRIIYNDIKSCTEPSVNIRYCGQSMIPSKVYPKECLTDEVEKIRDEICPICDESWFTPWLVANHVPVFCEHFGWGEDLSKAINKWQGLCSTTHFREQNGFTRRENWLYKVLMKFPKLLESYQKEFGYGK